MKWLIILLMGLFLLLQYKLWVGDGSVPQVHQLQKQVDATKAETSKLQTRNNHLKAEVKDLKTGLDAIEERARSELGMIRKDETFYQVIPDKKDDPND